MMIRVVYKDGEQQLVRPYVLKNLLDADVLEKFERSDGWAVIGDDRLRAHGTPPYTGPERRVPY